MKIVRRAAVLAASLSFILATPVSAQSDPFIGGDYVEVSSITVDDGHYLDYATFLADNWRKRQEFAKSKGWISGYEVLSNVNKRPGEPDLILVVRYPSMPTGAEGDKRGEAVRAYFQQTDNQMEAASGERAKFRHVIGSQLWQVMSWRKN